MSRSRTTPSLSAEERRVSRQILRRAADSPVPVLNDELFHCGYERRFLQESTPLERRTPYVYFVRTLLDPLEPLSHSPRTNEDNLIAAVRSFVPGVADLGVLFQEIEAPCAPSALVLVITQAAHTSTALSDLRARYRQLGELVENVRHGRVVRASFEGALGMGLIASRLGEYDDAFRYLYDAATYAALCHAPPLRAAAAAALLSATARISPALDERIVAAWNVSMATVHDEIPRFAGIVDAPTFDLVSQAPGDDAPDEDVVSYVERVRYAISAPLAAYTYDALLSTDETSVASQVRELAALSETMRASRDEMITMIADLDDVLTRLAEERRRVAEVADERQELLDLAAHEIKNPLVSISILAGRLETAKDEQTADAIRQEITEQIDTLDREIRRFLLGSADRRSDLFGDATIVDVVAILLDEWEGLRVQRDAASIEATVDAPPALNAEISETAVRVVVRNVLSNAVRYTPASGVINVYLEATPSGFLVRVRNTVDPGRAESPVYSSGRGLSLADSVLASIGSERTVTIEPGLYQVDVVFSVSTRSSGAEL